MKQVLSLGVDVGSISTKGVLLDDCNCVIAGEYLWTEGDPITAVKKLVASLYGKLPCGAEIRSVGTTGSARSLCGAMLSADLIKNEITAHAAGTLLKHPDVRTIIEIGGQDSKIILIRDGVVVDYAMNTLCAAGTGAFLSSQAKRLGLAVEDIGDIARLSSKPSRIAARCTVFAESDMVHKAQTGHKKEDLVAGLCLAVVTNYLNNVGKGKTISAPAVFQGGVSKNSGVSEAMSRELGFEVIVEPDSHLTGAIGAAALARKKSRSRLFDGSVIETEFKTTAEECAQCPNCCEIVSFYAGGKLVSAWGGRCGRYNN